jgi:hypothetical protein
MHTQPYQPLSDLDALRNENERLRNLLFHLANYVSVNVLPEHRPTALDAMIAEAKRVSMFLESDPTLE